MTRDEIIELISEHITLTHVSGVVKYNPKTIALNILNALEQALQETTNKE